MKLRNPASLTLACLVILYAIVVIAKIALEPQHFQLSFYTYHAAAQAFSAGLDPYSIDVLQELQPRIQGQLYVYPPLTLYFFLPFAALPVHAAYLAYLALKAGCLIGLVWIWHKWFLKRPLDGLFLLICLLGFNFAIYWDLSAGNISLFEQILLWTGLAAFLHGRLKTYAVMVACAASFKLTLILFLGLLVFRRGRPRWYAMLLGIGIFVGLLGLSSVLYSEMTISFVQNMRGTTPDVYGDNAVYYANPPASWPLLKSYSSAVCGKLGFPLAAGPLAVVAFLALVSVAAMVTWSAIRRCRSTRHGDNDVMAVMLFCLFYMIVVPRLMMYSYILVLPAAYYVALKVRHVNALLALLAVMSISTSPYRPVGIKMLMEILPDYYPLILTYVLWAAGIYVCMRAHKGEPLKPDSPESSLA